jgi:hypothetical protein
VIRNNSVEFTFDCLDGESVVVTGVLTGDCVLSVVFLSAVICDFECEILTRFKGGDFSSIGWFEIKGDDIMS